MLATHRGIEGIELNDWTIHAKKISFNGSSFMGLFTGKALMITGGTGSFRQKIKSR